MKKLFLLSVLSTIWHFGHAWSPVGQQIAQYEYEALYQGFWAYPTTGPYVLLVGNTTAADTQGILCHYYKDDNSFNNWTTSIPSNLRIGYKYTDVIGIFSGGEDWLYICGYKIADLPDQDQGKGIIFRCNFDPQGTVTPWGFQDLTADLPYPYYQGGKASPVLTIDYSADAATGCQFALTGGDGMILFTENFSQWTLCQTKPYVHDSSAWYKGFYTNRAGVFKFTVIEDDSGYVAWTTNYGGSWTKQHWGVTYDLPENKTLSGFYTPLSLPNSCDDWQWRIGIGMSMGKFLIENNNPNNNPLYHDPFTTNSVWWWFHGATGSDDNVPGSLKKNWFCGSDGGIFRYDYNSNDGSGGSVNWERDPENSMYYKMTSIGGYTFSEVAPRYNWADGDTLGRFLYSEQWQGGLGDPTPPSGVPDPHAPELLSFWYDANWHGYRFKWLPPDNAKESKVGGYWVCPPDPGYRYWVMHASPVSRLFYFYPWPTGANMDARVAAMGRGGQCGPFGPSIWLTTIDIMVDDLSTGRNNARRLLWGGDTLWAFWQKENQIHVGASPDSGKHWTYPYTAYGKWPAAGLKTTNFPAFCWLQNIDIGGEQVTAKLYYNQYTGSIWSLPTVLRQETFTGTGYLYPAISVDQSNYVHVVYGKSYNTQDWQLWYGKFPASDPRIVAWTLLDSCSGVPDPTVVLSPTIGTTKYDVPMIVYNKPNSSTFYFAYKDDLGWHTRILDFTGTMPCLEVRGTTAYLTYVNSADIWYSTGGTSGFSTPTRISNTLGTSSMPVLANNVITWEEYVYGDWEIYYSYLNPLLGWTTPVKLFGYAGLPDRAPQVTWFYPHAYVDWTQGASGRTIALSRKMITYDEGGAMSSNGGGSNIASNTLGFGVATFAYDLGDSTPSPVLTERSGYAAYGQEPGKTVDIGSAVLSYHLVELANDYSWQGRFLFYHQQNGQVSYRLSFNNTEPINISIPPQQVTEITCEIPEALLVNEELDVTIQPVNNDDLIYLGGMLFSYKTKNGMGGGPQSSHQQKTQNSVTLQCWPAIFSTSAQISYNLDTETEIQLLVYNAVGQQVAVIDKGMRHGSCTITWDVNDAHRRRLSSGIYFVRLVTSETNYVTKAIILR